MSLLIYKEKYNRMFTHEETLGFLYSPTHKRALCDWWWHGKCTIFSITGPDLNWGFNGFNLENSIKIKTVKSKEEFIKWFTEKYFMYLL